MNNVIAIVYAPGADKMKKRALTRKLFSMVDQIGFSDVILQINPDPFLKKKEESDDSRQITLIIGWGLPAKPSWRMLLNKISSFSRLRQLIAVDLLEREGHNGKVRSKPITTAGKYWGHQIQQNHLQLFIKGYYIRPSVPFGMKRIPVKNSGSVARPNRLRYTLKPGNPGEVKIVKHIFELFANHGYTRTEICNLLNAQGVECNNKSKLWDTHKILTILKTPMYIGANQYRKFITYDVFPPVVEKSTFFEAQARIWLFQNFSKDMKFRVITPDARK